MMERLPRRGCTSYHTLGDLDRTRVHFKKKKKKVNKRSFGVAVYSTLFQWSQRLRVTMLKLFKTLADLTRQARCVTAD